MNLAVWVVGQISDGRFDRRDIRVVPNMTDERFEALAAVGLVAGAGDDWRLGEELWQWQTSAEKLQQQADKRVASNRRVAEHRQRNRGRDSSTSGDPVAAFSHSFRAELQDDALGSYEDYEGYGE